MHPHTKIVSDSHLTLLKCLLNNEKIDRSIVLLGRGANGKSYIINECKDLIRQRGYECISEDYSYGQEKLSTNLFEEKKIIQILNIEVLEDIDVNKYYLLNFNL